MILNFAINPLVPINYYFTFGRHSNSPLRKNKYSNAYKCRLQTLSTNRCSLSVGTRGAREEAEVPSGGTGEGLSSHGSHLITGHKPLDLAPPQHLAIGTSGVIVATATEPFLTGYQLLLKYYVRNPGHEALLFSPLDREQNRGTGKLEAKECVCGVEPGFKAGPSDARTSTSSHCQKPLVTTSCYQN